jgi:hypothetical protein
MATKSKWLIGETVNITIKVKDPDSLELVDPDTVMLVSLKRGTTSLPTAGLSVVRVSTGRYRLSLPTDGYQEGTHHWLVAAEHADGRKAMVQDSFVLAAPV